MKTNDILLQSIKTLIQQEIEKAPFNKTKQGIITKNYMDGTYDVRFDGNLYTKILTYPNSTSLQLGQTVKIIIPNNQSSQMYISAEGSPLIYYPVGSYYETSDTTFNPNVAWGGTWVLETEGQVHISAGANYVVNGALTNATDGGEKTHKLTANELPHITGSIELRPWRTGTTNGAMQLNPTGVFGRESGSSQTGVQTSDVNASSYKTTLSFGNDQSHNNMQPYIVVNRWHRTA